jgi:iron complex transport system substrate-binding protein
MAACTEGVKSARAAFVAFVTFVSFVSFVPAQRPPTRIISLVPALTEMLFAIGAGPEVVAVSSYDTDPPEVLRLPKVGALLDPDVERILSLKPHLVLVYGSQTDLTEQLARAGISSFSYRHGGLAHVLVTIRALGERTGHREEAGRLAADIENRLDTVARRVAGRPRLRTLLVFGREHRTLRQIYVSGGRGFLHDMLEVAGGDNVFADADQESLQVSTETILARRPEAILEIRATDPPDEAELAEELRSWAPLASVPAVRNRRVLLIAGRSLVVPGPRVAEGVDRMARALHPEAFR